MPEKIAPDAEVAPEDHLGSWDQIRESFLDHDSRTGPDLSALMRDGVWWIAGPEASLEHFGRVAWRAACKLGFRRVDGDFNGQLGVPNLPPFTPDCAVGYWLEVLRRNPLSVSPSPFNGPAVVNRDDFIERVRSCSQFRDVGYAIQNLCIVSAQVCDQLYMDEIAGVSFDAWFRSLVTQFSGICPDLETFVEEYFPRPYLGLDLRRRDRDLSLEAVEELAEAFDRLHPENAFADVPWGDIFPGLDGQKIRAEVLLLSMSIHDVHEVDPQRRAADPLYLIKHAAAQTGKLLEGTLKICCDHHTKYGNVVTKEFLGAVRQNCLLPIIKTSLSVFGYRLLGIFLDERSHEALKQSAEGTWGKRIEPVRLALSRTEVAFDVIWNRIDLRLQLSEPTAEAGADQKRRLHSRDGQGATRAAVPEIKSSLNIAIRQALLSLDKKKKASALEVATWISEKKLNVTLPPSYAASPNFRECRDLGWLVNHDETIRNHFRSSVSKVRNILHETRIPKR